MSACVIYILLCADGSFYVGSTRKSAEERESEHNSGQMGGYTAARRPVRVVWSVEYDSIVDAIALERQIKGWSRAKKKALISGRFDLLPMLSKRGFRPGRMDSASFDTRPLGAAQDEDH